MLLSDLLARLMRREDLSEQEMALAIGTIMDGEASPVQIAAFLVALRQKGETPSEVVGAAHAMRNRMSHVHVDTEMIFDTCGTGGDGAGTFNISTAVAFVVAASGVTVAKHGNRAVSSKSGSADVLAELGVNLDASHEVVRRCIEEIGIGFLFAPSMHPAMRHAAPVRRELGVRTVFNVLGPLTNPAGATHQLMGVFDRELVEPIAHVLGKLGSRCAWVVHSADGLDEISVSDITYVAAWKNGCVESFTIDPRSLGIEIADRNALRGGNAKANAERMSRLLGGQEDGPICDAIALNAGAALCVADKARTLAEGLEQARRIIAQGEALTLVQRLAQLSQS